MGVLRGAGRATLTRGGGGDMAGAKTVRRSMPIPPEAADLANEANSVFVDEDYDAALELYTQVRPRPVAYARACQPFTSRRVDGRKGKNGGGA